MGYNFCVVFCLRRENCPFRVCGFFFPEKPTNYNIITARPPERQSFPRPYNVQRVCSLLMEIFAVPREKRVRVIDTKRRELF